MNYYKLTKDNTIEQYTTIPDGDPVPSFIEEEFTPTSRNIIRLHDGTLAFEDETDMDAEAAAVAEIKQEAEITAVDTQYQEDKSQLLEYYVEFLANGDAEGQAAVKAELDALALQYDADIEALNEEGEV